MGLLFSHSAQTPPEKFSLTCSVEPFVKSSWALIILLVESGSTKDNVRNYGRKYASADADGSYDSFTEIYLCQRDNHHHGFLALKVIHRCHAQ
ncbi:hypothetical protein MY3296_003106 [Beauveria thailandica]